MAINQRYRKIHETDLDVTYQYGDQEMDRELTIDKLLGTFTVADGREDHGTLAVVRGIMRRYRAENDPWTWPAGGGVQH